jgi:sirohydrochlorin ferrochelatase
MSKNGSGLLDTPTGLIIVDHGSRRDDSNRMLLELVAMIAASTPYEIVEAAHMELAEPSIQTAFANCVARGAKRVVIHPYFLLPGRHWERDIPQLVDDAARSFPGIEYLITAPLGKHPLMVEIVHDRVRQCLEHARGERGACEICTDTDRCQLHTIDPR